ncbi:MAG TPA: LPS assembly protein LptD [Vicinamibacterales bacterium]|jgi:LPS-assembly protein
MTRPSAVAALVFLLACAVPAIGQQENGFDSAKAGLIDRISKNHVKLIRAVEAQSGDTKFYADEVESFTDIHKVVATGNVTVRQPDSQISADRAEFNTETRLGTFYNATGFASIAERVSHDAMGGQEPDVYFYGRKIEKIGAKKYRISHGGFTTCLQPTPRWQITSGTVILNLDHYAFLANALVRAKGVPVFYLPVLFYPINKENRATGILMPTYGTSTLRGFSLSNAFFWAINRSQDATFMHDWFSARGQGVGGEYRYVSSPGSSGYLRLYSLNEHESTTVASDGSVASLPARKSYEIRSNLNQSLGHGWSARGRVDYFSDITAQQTYNTNIYDASRTSRSFGGSVNGQVKGFTINAAYDRAEYFSGPTDTTLTGGTPRVQFSRGDRPLFGTPVYFTMSGEYASLARESRSGDTITDRGLTRFDFQPTLRLPFTKWQFLTVANTLTWRATYWTRSQDPTTSQILDQSIVRRYFDVQSRITGPVVNRVWNTPNNGYAEKWKHTIEPYASIQHVTSVDNFNEVVQLDGGDYILGGTTRVDYGVTNRVLAKRRGGVGAGSAREILSVDIGQTYYTDSRAGQYDYNYSTSFSGQTRSNFSPILVRVRTSPADQINGSMQLYYDTKQAAIQSVTASGQVALKEWLSLTGGYSERRSVDALGTVARNNAVEATTALRSPGNRVGGTFAFSYDIERTTMLTSRIVGYYNAQCCGFAVEYQTWNYPAANAAFPIKQDHRFNFSFTLAGLGTFSNFFGALGGLGGGQR